MKLTVVSWNAEGLLPEASVAETLESLGDPDVLCLQEVRIRASDSSARLALESALPGYRAQYSLNRDPQNVRFRGGRAYGVVTYSKVRLGRPEIEVPDSDREGRIVISRFEKLTIANVYAVNGTGKPYFDHALGRIEGDRHAFKRRFQRMLLEHAAKLPRPLIVAGDWNVSQAKIDTHPRLRIEAPHAEARAELRALVESAGLVDVYRRLHPGERRYTWFNRRSRKLDAARVDFFLVSEDLVPATRSAEILDDPRFRTRTDHAPIVLEIET